METLSNMNVVYCRCGWYVTDVSVMTKAEALFLVHLSSLNDDDYL